MEVPAGKKRQNRLFDARLGVAAQRGDQLPVGAGFDFAVMEIYITK